MRRVAKFLRDRLGGYAVACAAAVGTTLLMAGLRPVLHPFVSPPFVLVVVFSAWRLGFGPAVTAAAVSVVALSMFAPVPNEPVTLADVAGSLLFLFVSLAMAWLAASLRRSRDERLALLSLEAAARAQAQEANRAKDRFLAILAHEFRTPLAAITASLHVLDRLPNDHEAAVRSRVVIRHQAEQLARMVEDLLDVNRIVSDRVTLELAPLDLAGAVAESVATVVSTGRTRDRRLKLEAEPVWVEADALRLQRAVVNVLDNAVKYTPLEGTIIVRVHPAGPEAVVEIEDTGIGIAPALLPRVFDLFVRADRTAQRGLGIGLAVVRRLVELHGGRICAASDGPGRGSRFTITLPRLTDPPDARDEHRHDARPAR
jgi:signal transduction histidine kinase